MVQGLGENLVLTGFGLVFVVAGLVLLNRARTERARSSEIGATETTAIRDLEAGPAEVKGTANAADGSTPFESPLRGTEALAARVEVDEWESSGRGGTWQTVHEEETAVPMLVDDGTGAVRVELPADGGLRVDESRTEVESDEEPPEAVRRYVEDTAGLEIPERKSLGPLSVGEPRRYAEGTIEPGAQVYVLGRAREVASWDGVDYVIDAPTASGEFVLSDKSEGELVSEGNVGGLVYAVFGGIATIVGASIVVLAWLP